MLALEIPPCSIADVRWRRGVGGCLFNNTDSVLYYK